MNLRTVRNGLAGCSRAWTRGDTFSRSMLWGGLAFGEYWLTHRRLSSTSSSYCMHNVVLAAGINIQLVSSTIFVGTRR